MKSELCVDMTGVEVAKMVIVFSTPLEPGAFSHIPLLRAFQTNL